MTAPTITALPAPPSAAATFSDDADAFLEAIDTNIDESNALAKYRGIHDPIVELDALATASIVAQAGEPAIWVTGTTYARGDVRWSPTDWQDYVRKIAGAGSTDPASDTTNWQLVTGTGDSTLTGTETYTNKTLKNVTIRGTVKEEIYTIDDGGSVDIDPSDGSIQIWEMWADREPTAAGWANGQEIVLIVHGAGWSIDWSTINPTWVNGIEPILTAMQYSWIVLQKRGGTFEGKYIGQTDHPVKALFANGEQGGIWLPSPKHCYTDTARTTLAAVADTVAAIADLSGRGNHATQSTAASRPILGCHPVGGRRNLLVQTEDLTTGWTKTRSTISANAIAAPDGTLTADKLVEDNSAATSHLMFRAYTFAATTYTMSFYAKAAERSWIRYSNADVVAYFDVGNGAVGTVTGGSGSISSIGGGWYRCVVTWLSTASAAGNSFFIAEADADISYSGDNTSGLYFWGAQLETGSTASAYQKVVSTYEITEAGKQTLYHLVYDGTDDYLVTNAIDFTASAKLTIWAGLRKLSDAARGMFLELGAVASDASSPNADWYFAAPDAAASNFGVAIYGPGGAAAAGYTPAPYAAPTTKVVSIAFDAAGANRAANLAVRVNATLDQTAPGGSNTGIGATQIENAALYMGRRGGSSLPFNGYCYGLTIRGGATVEPQITQTERYMGTKTGVSI